MKRHDQKKNVSRRTFLQAAAAATALSGCSMEAVPNFEPPPFTDAQRAARKTGKSDVAIVKCPSYDDDLLAKLKEHAGPAGLPSLKGKSVVIKPNMIEYRPQVPITADPAMIAAAAALADSLGAREIIVAEGPGHFRDTEYLLEMTGIGAALQKAGLPFVDLNLDRLVKVDNLLGITRAKEFYLPATVVEADVFISLPKLKTHHWVGVTASMKNLFGTVPGQKYGWPKNFLHYLGIDLAIIDLVHLVKPAFAIVDAIIAMEGDGPVNGTARHAGFMVMGTDLAAVDATCARAIGLTPEQIKYLRIAGEIVGNILPHDINILGSTLESVSSVFALPSTFAHKKTDKQADRSGC